MRRSGAAGGGVVVTVTMPGRVFVAGAKPSCVEQVRELWERLYVLADKIDTVEALMEKQASWICRHRDRGDLGIYQARWNGNDVQRLALHAEVEQLIYRANRAMEHATEADRAELGALMCDGGDGMAEWFASFVPRRDIAASWCPEEVICDGHVF